MDQFMHLHNASLSIGFITVLAEKWLLPTMHQSMHRQCASSSKKTYHTIHSQVDSIRHGLIQAFYSLPFKNRDYHKFADIWPLPTLDWFMSLEDLSHNKGFTTEFANI